jgi:Raf kinase inhibitor-like YbhB/YbcL family protein
MKIYVVLLIYVFVLSSNIKTKINRKRKFSIKDLQKDFLLASSTLKNGENIDSKFTPDGKDINPSVYWDPNSIPKETKSFAFSVEDKDAPRGLFYHWIVINIPKETKMIAENSLPGNQVKNSWNLKKYKGPFPPKNQKHRYIFRLFALSADHLNINNIKEFESAIERYKLAESSIIVTYKRKTKKNDEM